MFLFVLFSVALLGFAVGIRSRFLFLVVIALAALSFASCKPVTYTPQVITRAPLSTERFRPVPISYPTPESAPKGGVPYYQTRIITPNPIFTP